MEDFDFQNIFLQTATRQGKTTVFDPIRKKNILLTPEEEVRQKIIHYLIHQRAVPMALIAIERGIKINGMTKRFDLVIFNTDGNPWLAIECKAPSIKLTQNALQQLANYNLHLKAPFMMVSNGWQHMISEVNFETRQIAFLQTLPFLTP